MKNILLTCLLIAFLNVKSQQTFTAEINKTGVARIEFNAPSEIKNFLLLIFTAGGETVVFESRNKFSGFYQKYIDLKAHGRGQYFIRLVRDEEISQVSLTVD